jgi:hypothetical protein
MTNITVDLMVSLYLLQSSEPWYFSACFTSFSHYSPERKERELTPSHMFLASTVLWKFCHVGRKISIPSPETVNVLRRLFMRPTAFFYKIVLPKRNILNFSLDYQMIHGRHLLHCNGLWKRKFRNICFILFLQTHFVYRGATVLRQKKKRDKME